MTVATPGGASPPGETFAMGDVMTNEQQSMGPPPLRSAAVAARYGVTKRTVAQWVRDGKLKAFRPPGGGPYYFPVESLVAFENPSDSLMTPEDVASRWGKDVETVRRWCRSGDLDSFKTPGGRILIPLTAVECMERRPGGLE